jgi:hypothetical protein
MAHTVPSVCDVALRPTRPKGHVAERRGAAPRNPRRPPGRRSVYALLCTGNHIMVDPTTPVGNGAVCGVSFLAAFA